MSSIFAEWDLSSRYSLLHMIVPAEQITATATNAIFGISSNCTAAGFTRNAILHSANMPIYNNNGVSVTCSLLGGGLYLSEGATVTGGSITATFSNNSNFGGTIGGTPTLTLAAGATSSFAIYAPGQYRFPQASNDIIIFSSTTSYTQTANSHLYLDFWAAG